MLFTSLLLAWYESHARQLPWRGTGNPYHVWLSEVILQQTRVAQGIAYYYNFLEQFPTIHALATATLDQVLKCWQGLGYYTRARNLHKAAQLVVEKYGGELPSNYLELKSLPGLGAYSAGAVASFAFNIPVPAIDGNGYRVLARYFGKFEPTTTGAGQRVFRKLCEEQMTGAQPSDFNQALIDFGALVCIPGIPRCQECPLSYSCYAHKHQKQLELPLKTPPIKLRIRNFHYLVLLDGKYTYIEQRTNKDIWHSLYQFPLIEAEVCMEHAQLSRTQTFKQLITADCTLIEETPESVQKLTHQELHLRFFILKIIGGNTLPAPYLHVEQTSITDYQVPISIARFLASEVAKRYF